MAKILAAELSQKSKVLRDTEAEKLRLASEAGSATRQADKLHKTLTGMPKVRAPFLEQVKCTEFT